MYSLVAKDQNFCHFINTFHERAAAAWSLEEVTRLPICCLTTKFDHAFQKKNKCMQAIAFIYFTGL